MLFLRKRSERISREHDAEFERTVTAVQRGVVNAFNQRAAEAWRRRMTATSSAPTQSVEAYKATLVRLGSLTNQGKPLGLVN